VILSSRPCRRSSTRKASSKTNGFSLVEIMIVLMILATLGTLVGRAISQAVKAKIKIQDQIDQASRLRDSVKLMQRDIELAYHHLDWEKELQDLIKKKSTPSPAAAPNSAPPNPGFPNFPPPPNQAETPEEKREVPRVDPVTHFVGSADSLHFVTMNQMQMSREALQADFVEVGYALKECRSTDGKITSQCLWRRSANLVDTDVTKGGEELVLLENVTEFKLKYIGVGKQDWVDDWKTNSSQDVNVRNKFPSAVEISITAEKKVDGKKGKTYSMQTVVPIHFPNNKDDKAGSSGSSAPGSQFPQPGAPLRDGL
jgi:prepilin-type N-terminal cleavage/methylation domain-containing protein